MVATLLMGLTQYVVCPYDTMSYALLVLSFLLITRPFRFSFPLLVAAVVAGAMTKESTVLALSFFCAFHHANLLKFRRKELVQLLILVGAFVNTYALLRLLYGLNNRGQWQTVTLWLNLRDPFAWLGVASLPVLSYLLCVGTRHVKRCLLFLAACSPYIISMPVIAQVWETRLWVPVWLGLLCLARDIAGDSAPTAGRHVPEHAALS
jgi:hypothetical protein